MKRNDGKHSVQYICGTFFTILRFTPPQLQYKMNDFNTTSLSSTSTVAAVLHQTTTSYEFPFSITTIVIGVCIFILIATILMAVTAWCLCTNSPTQQQRLSRIKSERMDVVWVNNSTNSEHPYQAGWRRIKSFRDRRVLPRVRRLKERRRKSRFSMKRQKTTPLIEDQKPNKKKLVNAEEDSVVQRDVVVGTSISEPILRQEKPKLKYFAGQDHLTDIMKNNPVPVVSTSTVKDTDYGSKTEAPTGSIPEARELGHQGMNLVSQTVSSLKDPLVNSNTFI